MVSSIYFRSDIMSDIIKFLYYFIIYMVFVLGMSGSPSISQVLLGVALILLIWLIKIIYIRNKKSKMGNQLIKLNVPNSLSTNLIISIILIVAIILIYYFNIKTGFLNIKTGIFALFVASPIIDQICAEKFFGRVILEKGICFNGDLIEWHRIQSYEWIKRRKESEYSMLEISRKTNKLIKMDIFDDQKEKVDEVLKRMLSV